MQERNRSLSPLLVNYHGAAGGGVWAVWKLGVPQPRRRRKIVSQIQKLEELPLFQMSMSTGCPPPGTCVGCSFPVLHLYHYKEVVTDLRG
jgi:hypothetical protein